MLATDPQDGLLAIVRQLLPPQEQIAEAQVGGADPYPADTLEDVSVRQVANRLAVRRGPYGIWSFGGARDFRAFGFFNIYLNCTRVPDEPPSGRATDNTKEPGGAPDLTPPKFGSTEHAIAIEPRSRGVSHGGL